MQKTFSNALSFSEEGKAFSAYLVFVGSRYICVVLVPVSISISCYVFVIPGQPLAKMLNQEKRMIGVKVDTK